MEVDHLGTLREIRSEGLSGLDGEASKWEVLEMAVDSGASATVIGERDLETIQALGANPEIQYETADGTKIPHLGSKTFYAHMETGEVRKLTAQVTEVNKCLLSVSRMVGSGNTVVFDGEGSYIQNKASGQIIPMEERGGMYVLKMWVAKNQAHPF